MRRRGPSSGPGGTGLIDDDPSVELSANRTSLSFERTLMSADRTLMAAVRAGVSMIGFGFTIHESFRHLGESGALPADDLTGRRVGASLLALGVGMLVIGILGHVRFLHNLTLRREHIVNRGLLHHALHYSATPSLVAAILLLLIGLAALSSVLIQIQT
ncbi:DUF202 domain-containing protein [Brevundimonas sp. NPDC058933]|uniref:DUF202 domain-containing protein n=1 Tax=Brevundimonas sp. NPDC058933 TaxID=3346673 RepID=UPI003BEEEB45